MRGVESVLWRVRIVVISLRVPSKGQGGARGVGERVEVDALVVARELVDGFVVQEVVRRSGV